MMVETQRITEESEKHGQLELEQGSAPTRSGIGSLLYCTCVHVYRVACAGYVHAAIELRQGALSQCHRPKS